MIVLEFTVWRGIPRTHFRVYTSSQSFKYHPSHLKNLVLNSNISIPIHVTIAKVTHCFPSPRVGCLWGRNVLKCPHKSSSRSQCSSASEALHGKFHPQLPFRPFSSILFHFLIGGHLFFILAGNEFQISTKLGGKKWVMEPPCQNKCFVWF